VPEGKNGAVGQAHDHRQRNLNAGEPKQREQLRVAQRLRIHYRDANCLYCGLDGGTIARVESGDCMLRMTQSRAIELVGKEDCS
jgi:uncharacterized protein YecT (DUF1311 family)